MLQSHFEVQTDVPVGDVPRQADIVLLDSPPCLLYSDAFVLSPLVDGILYVVRSGSQDKAAQRRVQRQLGGELV